MRLTEKLVAKLEATGRDYVEWDDALPGFGVRVKPSGARSYLIQYRNRAGDTRRMTLGACSVFRLEAAREWGRKNLAASRLGDDPAEVKKRDCEAVTVAQLAERYLHDHAEPHKKRKSVVTDRANLANHIVPELGRKRVADVTSDDVERLHRAIRAGKHAKDEKVGFRSRRIVRGGPGVANRCVSLLGKMMNLAERWKLRPPGSNPCRGLEKFKEQRIERWLAGDELARLGDALKGYDGSPYAVAAIKLLAFTGARLGEVLGLRWEWIDFERGEVRLPDSKTGAKTIHLPPPALTVLADLPRIDGNPFVICGANPREALVNLQKPWRAIRAAAGLDDVRIHDLRHAFASVAAMGGLSLPIIGKMLGHSQPATTARYAHLASDPVKAAAASVAGKIAAALDGKSERKEAG